MSAQPANPGYLEFLNKMSQVGITTQQGNFLLDNLVTAQGYMLSTNRLMLISAAIFLCLMPLIWLSRPPFGSGKGGH
jgi:DHA2 family multidrug resistance protein